MIPLAGFRRSIAVRLWAGLLLAVISGSWIMEAQLTSAQVESDGAGLTVGARPPGFSATDLNGSPHSLQRYQGKIVVLHFWASWCPYCRGEIPKLTRIQEEWASKGVAVLAISADEDVAQLKRFVAKERLPYPVIADAEARSSVASRYQLTGVPTTYVVARDGRIASRIEGRGDLIGAVQRALSQPPS